MESASFHWSLILRGNLSYGLHPRMLLDEGYALKSPVAIKGENPGINRDYRQFIFDRSYVNKFIIAKVIKPLNITNRDDLLAVINEAWDEHYKQWQGEGLDSCTTTIEP